MKITSYAKALALLANNQLRLYDITIDTEPLVAGKVTTMVLVGGVTGDNGGMNMAGRAPDIRMWDAECVFPSHGINLGLAPIKPNEMTQVEMAKLGKKQMPWVLFSANDDAVCLAWAGVTWPDLSAYVWVGDWARACDRDWYYSDTLLQGTNHKPACQWIDLNGDRPETGFSLHWPSFTMDRESLPTNATHISRLKHHICNDSPYMSHRDYDPHAIRCDPHYSFPDVADDRLWNPDGSRRKIGPRGELGSSCGNDTETGLGASPSTRTRERRRSRPTTRRNQAHHDSSLVITDDPTHSAEELCAHPSSRGPNLVNTLEGNYCHMADKSLWPVCSSGISNGCFDKDARLLMVEGLNKKDRQFTRILDWTGNSTTTHRV